MYLLVFVTLLIGIIGLYAQVIGVQAARINANQSGIADAMRQWHSTAVGLARSAVNPTDYDDIAGCRVSIAPPGTPGCRTVALANVTVGGAQPVGMPLCSSTVATNCWTTPPQGYNDNAYAFNSIVYQAAAVPANQNFVITFVPPPTINAVTNPAPGLVSLPQEGLGANSRLTGFSISDLYRQLQKSGIPALAYGTVELVGGITRLTTTANSGGVGATNLNYPVPTNIPLGSIAIISSPGSAQSCPTDSTFNIGAQACFCNSTGAVVPASGICPP